MEEETSSRRGGGVGVLSLFPIHLIKRKRVSLFYSLDKKEKLFFFPPASFVVLRVCTRDARGDIAFWFRFNRTRRARGSRSSK
jgi:hypothetical protein